MQKLFLQSLIIAGSFFLVFIWEASSLAVYTVPALGVMTALYLIATMRKRGSHRNQLITAFLLITSSLLLLQATGGMASFLFFLLYFICFYISFTLMPETVFVFSLATVLFFLPEMKDLAFINIAKLTSFILLAPLAYFFGKTIAMREKEIKQTENMKKDIQAVSENIIKDVSDIVKAEGKSLKVEDIDRLKDIVQQSRKIEKETSE